MPDVPEDIDDALMEHLNDPNYDLNLVRSTTTLTTTSVQTDGKAAVGAWSDASTSSDAESQIDASRTSESDFKESYGSQSTYLESVFLISLLDASPEDFF